MDIASTMEFPGLDGFLGTRASLMLDVVFTTMFAVIPLMLGSIALARFRNAWQWHKRIQLTLATVLLLAVTAFEIDMQFVTQWELRAEPSPYFSINNKWTCPVGIATHRSLVLCRANSSYLDLRGKRSLEALPQATDARRVQHRHKLWGRIAAVEMTMTAITGWVFYWLAFVA